MGLDRSLVAESDGTTLETHQVSLQLCPICAGQSFAPRYRIGNMCIESCRQCGLAFQNPQPSDEQLNEIYGPNYFLFSDEDPVAVRQFETIKRATARLQLAELASYLRRSGRAPRGLRLLEIGCGHGHLLMEARDAGYVVHGLDYSAHAAAAANHRLGNEVVRVGPTPTALFSPESFDVCILADVIEHVRDPRRFLGELFRLVDKNGVVFIATPDLGSWSAKLLGRHWVEYKLEHLYYFKALSIKRLLSELGFTAIEAGGNRKVLTADYIMSHFDRYPMPGLASITRIVRRIIPDRLLRMNIKISVGSLSVFATKPS